MVVIFITSIYMVLMMSACVLVCGDAYKDRVVFLTQCHTAMWIEVPLMPLIHNMLQEALLFNLQIMIHNLSILSNAQDSAART